MDYALLRNGAPEMDAIEMLTAIAEDCDRTEDACFWILTSAAAHLRDHHDEEGSTVAHYLGCEAKETFK